MKGPVTQPVALSIGTIRLRAASSIEARRLADALPAALAQALADDGTPITAVRTSAQAAARDIATAIRAARSEPR